MTPYSFMAFVRDRRPYIVVYLAFALLTVAVVQLDLWLSGSTLRFANLIYILILGLVGLVLFLWAEYQRQSGFVRHLTRTVESDSLEEWSLLPSPHTLEQQVYAEAWQRLYATLSMRLSEERRRSERRLHFLSQWAHYMKTPVSVIDLELQKVRGESPESVEQFVQSVAEENERLRQSLQALLNTLRLDDFASDFKVEPVRPIDLAREVVNAYRHAFIAHEVYPRIEEPADETPGELLTVESDAKWLRLILEQVVSNAIKYSADSTGGGKVTIRLLQEDGTTVLEVEDNGIGIRPEDLGRVFDPFFTGSTGRKHAASTGMGLYLAKEACQRLGHTISIGSTPGEGTRVRIGFQRDASIFADLKECVTER